MAEKCELHDEMIDRIHDDIALLRADVKELTEIVTKVRLKISAIFFYGCLLGAVVGSIATAIVNKISG